MVTKDSVIEEQAQQDIVMGRSQERQDRTDINPGMRQKKELHRINEKESERRVMCTKHCRS